MTLAAGTRLGPYEISASIGAGGMGEVFRARDVRLGRDVAIKVLSAEFAGDPARLLRFEHEARAVAALSHPNILAVYDVGQAPVPFLVTELLDGDTLRAVLDRGPMPVRRLIDVALQFTAGLAAAHLRGIVHRDLKPANLFVTRDDVVKILDFGLAKAVADGATAATDVTSAPTIEGTLIGTVGYMAPEQVRGASTDHRADIFACGTLLYEMLTGQRAFQGDSPADTMSAVLRGQPAEPEIKGHTPPALMRIIRRCLEKDPGLRFQSVRDLRFAIESLSDAGATATASLKSEPKSVAVLPFTNMSADPENEYFSDGLAEELINALARLPGLRVASRTSAFRFRGGTDIREVARQLNVDTVLEGSVRRIGKRLRITSQLVNAADGYQLWSERYDREMADVFEIQDEITASIVKTLEPALLGTQQSVAKRHTDNPQAYELYLKGRHFWYQRTESTLRAAIECFEGAIDFDPDYALAHAGIADSYSIMRIYCYVPAAESRRQAGTAADRALALDPDLSEAHFAKALDIAAHSERWTEAEDHFARAVTLAPQSAIQLVYQGFFLGTCRRNDEAAATVARAVALDPLSPFAHGLGAMTLYGARRFTEAIQLAERALDLHHDFALGLWALGISCSATGQHERAIEALGTLVKLSKRAVMFLGSLGFAYARAGREAEARALVADLRRRQSETYIAPIAEWFIHLGLRDREAMCASFEACLADHQSGFALQVLGRPWLDEFALDRRIGDYLRRLNIIPS